AIERQVYGDAHEEVADSLTKLALICAFTDDFTGARAACREVLAIRTKLYGAADWRGTHARLALAGCNPLAALHAARARRWQWAKAMARGRVIKPAGRRTLSTGPSPAGSRSCTAGPTNPEDHLWQGSPRIRHLPDQPGCAL